MPSRAVPMLPGTARSTFQQFRTCSDLPGTFGQFRCTFGQFRAKPDSARKCPKLHRNCPKLFRAVQGSIETARPGRMLPP
eukprot:13070453-Alexandrium_andersonii.AAC.1